MGGNWDDLSERRAQWSSGSNPFVFPGQGHLQQIRKEINRHAFFSTTIKTIVQILRVL
jgi:hypothetical protein